MDKPSVIVVNSLVARGGVGGRASVFALERLGFPVIFVPTLVLPWHPGHGRATRMEPDAGDLCRASRRSRRRPPGSARSGRC